MLCLVLMNVGGVLILAVLILILDVHRWRCWHGGIQVMIFGLSFWNPLNFLGFVHILPVWHAHPASLDKASHVTGLPGISLVVTPVIPVLIVVSERWFLRGKNCQNVLFTQFPLKEQNHIDKLLHLVFLWMLWMWWRMCFLWGLCSRMLASAPSLSYLVYCHNHVFMVFKPEVLTWFNILNLAQETHLSTLHENR